MADSAVEHSSAATPVNTSAATPSESLTERGQTSGPAIAWVGVNTHVTDGADLPPQEQSQDAFEKFAKAIQSPATLKGAKVCWQLHSAWLLKSVNEHTVCAMMLDIMQSNNVMLRSAYGSA